MAAFSLAPAVAAPASTAPAARGNGRAEAKSGSSEFDHVLGSQDSGKDERTDAGHDATGSTKAADARPAGDAKDKNKDDSGSDKPQTTDDPKALLGWLQGQVAAPATPAAPSPAAIPQGATSAEVAAFRLTLAPKNLTGPGDTPPTQRPADPSASAAALVSDGTTLPAAFSLAGSGKTESSSETTTLNAAQSVALTAAVATAAAAAPEAAARNVEAFQALLGKAESNATIVTPPATGATPTPAATALATPLALDSPDLPQRLGDRLQWLADSGIQEARLQLHPRELGTVNVQLRIESHGATVWFAAEHPAARAALESSLPQLRERFASDGVALAQTQVTAQTAGWTFGSTGSQQQPQSQSAFAQAQSGFGTADSSEDLPAIAAPKATVHIGLIDRYA